MNEEMKKQIIYILTSLMLVAGFASCEKELQLYHEEACALNFYYSDGLLEGQFKEDMAKANYSFVYAGSSVMVDTVWFKVRTMGFVYDVPRAFEIEQVQAEGENNAVAGKHYVAFNDPSLAQFYQIGAGTSHGEFPVVVLRDASLADQDVVLKMRIKANDNFENGYGKFQERTLIISANLSMPSLWNYDDPYYIAYDLGDWGPVKHQWLIDQTGEKWDDEYLTQLYSGDSGYRSYLIGKLQIKLAEENEARAAQGLDPLCEADGTEVVLGEVY